MASIAVDASLKERPAAYLRQHSYQVRDYGDGLDYPDVGAEGRPSRARPRPARLRHRPRHGPSPPTRSPPSEAGN